MLEYSPKYAALGWAVFPCRPGDKRPATQHGCLDATTDVDQIRAWWTEIPDLNIGLACGEISGITALDIDPRSNGHEFLAEPLTITSPSTVYGNRRPAAAVRTTSLPTATRPT